MRSRTEARGPMRHTFPNTFVMWVYPSMNYFYDLPDEVQSLVFQHAACMTIQRRAVSRRIRARARRVLLHARAYSMWRFDPFPQPLPPPGR